MNCNKDVMDVLDLVGIRHQITFRCKMEDV